MSFFTRMNPTLRGFLIIALIAAVIVAFDLGATLGVLLFVARIAFLIAIAFFIYRMWRERRGEIAEWSLRARVVFYGAALLAIAALAVNWWVGSHGLEILAFVAILACCGFAMWRVWRDEHTYS